MNADKFAKTKPIGGREAGLPEDEKRSQVPAVSGGNGRQRFFAKQSQFEKQGEAGEAADGREWTRIKFAKTKPIGRREAGQTPAGS